VETYGEIDVRRAANTAAKADRAVDHEDRFLLGILHDELRRTLAVPKEKSKSLAKPMPHLRFYRPYQQQSK